MTEVKVCECLNPNCVAFKMGKRHTWIPRGLGRSPRCPVCQSVHFDDPEYWRKK